MVRPVYLYVPNLIGYARIIFSLASYPFALTNWQLCFLCYSISYALDAVDGPAARRLKQTSRFGAVLDMVADRSSSACLLAILGTLYQPYQWIFLCCISIDVISHFAHVYASLLGGGESHKKIDEKKSWLLRAYYDSSSYMLFWMCTGNEAFFIFMYVWNFTAGPAFTFLGQTIGAVEVILFVTFPVCAVKQGINIVQFFSAAETICEFEESEHRNK